MERLALASFCTRALVVDVKTLTNQSSYVSLSFHNQTLK